MWHVAGKRWLGARQLAMCPLRRPVLDLSNSMPSLLASTPGSTLPWLVAAVSRLSRQRTRLPHPPPPTPPCAHPAVRQQQPAALHIHPQDLRAAQLPHDPQQHHLHEQQVSARCSARLSRAWALPQPCGKCLQAAVSQELRRFVPAQAPPCAPCSQVHHNLLCHHHQRLEGVQMPTSEGGLLL